jgi:hypothetical protein
LSSKQQSKAYRERAGYGAAGEASAFRSHLGRRDAALFLLKKYSFILHLFWLAVLF